MKNSNIKWNSLAGAGHQDNYDLVLILMDTGARYSEIANLKWEQINLTDKTINLWRSKVSATVILNNY
jgi:integrase